MTADAESTVAGAQILVVDDQPGIRFFLSELLGNEGHDVVAVSSGEKALAKIAEQEFDLALVDLKLDRIGGLQVLEQIQAQTPDTVVIVLTAHASLQTAVTAMRRGAHDYLFKPCKTADLRNSIHQGLLKRQERLRQRMMLQRLEKEQGLAPPQAGDALPGPQRQERERFLQRGSLIIDFTRHVITLEGRLLELSPTEFDVLAYLASAAPRVVSSQELVRDVQGYESNPEKASEIVRYHIYRIRRKMKEQTGCSGLIRTVRGVGYALDENAL